MMESWWSNVLWSPLLWIGGLTYLIYRYLTHGLDYFEKRGVPHDKPIPFFGNAWKMWKKNLLEEDIEKLKRFGPIWGEIVGFTRIWVVADTELLKKIFVKEFESFSAHMNFFTGNDQYVNRFLSVINGQEWKDIRSAVSPGFSSGKIKNMSYLMKECAESLIDVIRSERELGTVGMKRICSSFAIDVVASCAFGTKIESLRNPNNEFYLHIKNMFQNMFETPLVIVPFLIGDKIKRLLPPVLNKKALKFYSQIVKAILQTRRNEPSNRNDFLDALLETKKNDSKCREVLDEVTIISQSLLFFLAGFDTVAATVTYVAYSLATNPEVQEKLHEEIVKKSEECGSIDHESIQQMKYLDACIKESLRLYPIGGRIERQVTNTITIDGYTFEKGTTVMIPVYAVHHDEKYFEDPYQYKPERFLTMDKELLNSVWLPFGMGPRNCIGMRFAMEEIKLALCNLVTNFKFHKSDKTPEHLQFMRGIYSCILRDVYLKVEPREDNQI